jgi:hypothetical protein
VDKEPVGVIGARRPEMATDEPGEPEDDSAVARDRTVTDARAHHRERVLIDELLLEVIELGSRVQLSRPVKRSDNSQGHECFTSSRSSICHEYHRYVRNLDQSSFQTPSAAWLSWPWSADQQPISASGGSARTFDKSNTTKKKKEGDLPCFLN